MTARRTAAVLVGATALTWTAGPALAAAGDVETGYWARTRTGLPVPVQPPDPVPEGGTWVSGDPSGPVAVSALRSALAPGLVAVELRLTVADAVGTPAVQACPTTERWAAEQGGRLEAAPLADCSAPLDAKVDGEVLVVPLPPGLDAVDVLLRPAPGSAFSLTMERATPASVVTAPAPAAQDTPAEAPVAAPPPTGTAEPPPFAAPPPFDAPLSPALEPPPVAFAPEPLLAAPALSEPPAAAAPAPQTAPQAALVPAPAPVAAPRPAVPDDRLPTLLAAAVLAALGAQAVRLGRQPAAPPRVLGGAARRSRPEAVPAAPAVPVPVEAGARARGVGRFRSARVRPPVRL